jgi:hypothetical protein
MRLPQSTHTLIVHAVVHRLDYPRNLTVVIQTQPQLAVCIVYVLSRSQEELQAWTNEVAKVATVRKKQLARKSALESLIYYAL